MHAIKIRRLFLKRSGGFTHPPAASSSCSAALIKFYRFCILYVLFKTGIESTAAVIFKTLGDFSCQTQRYINDTSKMVFPFFLPPTPWLREPRLPWQSKPFHLTCSRSAELKKKRYNFYVISSIFIWAAIWLYFYKSPMLYSMSRYHNIHRVYCLHFVSWIQWTRPD